MKNTFYDKINHKKAVWIIIRNIHSKELCDNIRDFKKNYLKPLMKKKL